MSKITEPKALMKLSPWLNPESAAEYLGLKSAKAVYQAVREGRLLAHRFGRLMRFRVEDLDKAMKPQPNPFRK